MRKYNINFKLLGIMGLAVNLLAATFPIEPHSAFAANGYEVPLRDKIDVQSTVTLTMDAKPANEDASLNASGGIDPDDSGKVIRRTASIELGNTNGFTVSISGNSDLVGKNSANTLPSVSTTSTLGQMSNGWGWAGNVGDSANDCNPATLSFKGMSASEQQLGSGGAVSSGTKKVTMCFGARVNGEKPADTYSNTVTLSVVAQPGQVGTFNNITKMQEMTPEICRAAKVNDTAQLEDVRDGKKYWVTKLLDGNCWMSQNLDFDISATNVTTATSDVTNNWTTSSSYPPNATTSAVNSIGSGDSWDSGTYILDTPTNAESCSSTSIGISACSAQGFKDVSSWVASTDPNFYQTTKYKGTDNTTDCTKIAGSVLDTSATGVCRQYDAHYLIGNYYSWKAATAGTGAMVGSAEASGSICPKNWQLPKAEISTTGQNSGRTHYLLMQYGLAKADSNSYSDVSGVSSVNNYTYNIALPPLYFIRSGYIENERLKLENAGRIGYYQLSTGNQNAASGALRSGRLELSSSVIYSYAYGWRDEGLAVRCLVNV